MISLKKYINLAKNVHNWPNYFYAKHIDTKQNPVVFQAGNGVVIEVPKGTIMAIFKEIFMEDLYDIAFLKAHLQPRAVIVDVGANLGFFALFMASQLPDARIFAYEPLPTNFKHLQRHFRLNNGKALVAENKAVAGEKGSLDLYYNPDVSYTPLASLRTDFEDTNTSRVTVEAVSLPDIFASNRLDRIDLLKLDCEGAEYDILYRCPDSLLQKVRLMAMETHPGTKANENKEALCAFLTAKGFTVKIGDKDFVWAWREGQRAG
jgi:FkbM family methyltransferase